VRTARPPRGIGAILDVARGEALRLVRDRKAILLAVVLPILSYPILIWGSQKFGDVGRRQIEERPLRLAIDLDGLDASLAGVVRARLAAEVERAVLEDVDLDEWRPALAGGRDAARAAKDTASHRPGDPWAALVVGSRDEDGTARISLVFEGAGEDGIAAATQVLTPMRALASELESDAFRARLGHDPAARFRLETADVVRSEDARGMALGRFLPLIAVLVLLSGGAFAALDAFAGEREQGTLETLLVQPLPASTFAYGKFLVVLGTALAAWCGNVASLIWSVESGLFQPVAQGLPAGGALGMGRILTGAALFLPTVVLLAAALCVIAARARSFREGQHYLMPATLLGAALAAPALTADIRLDAWLALVPLTGPSLALRDALAGELAVLPAIVAATSSLVWAGFALSRITSTLDAERLLAAPPPKEADPSHHVVKRAMRAAIASLVLVYVVGSWLQAKDLVYGLVATLFGLVLGLAAWVAVRNAQDRRTGVSVELGLLPTRAGFVAPLVGVLAALIAGPGLAWLARGALVQQQRVVPLPPGLGGEFEAALTALPIGALLFLLAVGPAICEELLFRGAILRGLLASPRTTIVRAVLVQAIFFALVHASIHRLPLTFALGVILALVTLRAGVVWPAIALHASYNAAQVLSATRPEWGLGSGLWLVALAPLALWFALARRGSASR
jgi:sodium transport system permease protein